MATEAARSDPKMEGGPEDAKAGDPSMEEILQSIRRIIAEDEAPAGDTALEIPGSDVLELTEMVQEDGTVARITSAALAPEVSDAPPSDVLASIDSAMERPASSPSSFTPAPVTAPMPDMPSEAPAATAPLLSDSAAAGSANAFRKLAQSREKPRAVAAESPEFRSGDTVEDLVLEMLRPLLKAWLDANLQGIVERIVEREVKRLSGGL